MGKKALVLVPMSAEARAALKQIEQWMDGFHSFLEDTLGDSEQNRKQVTRQAKRLASGEGVPHPRSSAVFMQGQPVTLGSDFLTLIDEAQAWEDKYGEDYGHGWLLRHPLKKLHLYQAFLASGGQCKAPEEPSKPSTPASTAQEETLGKRARPTKVRDETISKKETSKRARVNLEGRMSPVEAADPLGLI